MIDKLIDEIKRKENPSVVGLDPRLDFVPGFIKEEAFKSYGRSLKGAAAAFLSFNKRIIDAVADIVPAVKPQIAMYERLGADGVAAYIDTINYAKGKNLVVIGDVKRGDVASTAKAYSDGHIGRVRIDGEEFTVFNEDFITVNPYLGGDSLTPYIEDCEKYDKGVFVLVKTSNPMSGQIQDLPIVDKGEIYQEVGLIVSGLSCKLTGKNGFSSIGAVVGATHREQAEKLRRIMPSVFFLVPGYGAQGGSAEDIAVCFNDDGIGAVVNSSRGIIAAYKNEKYEAFGETGFAEAARRAAIDMKEELVAAIK
ncbi:MAG: orotidine-5'-phosphate decarboxylase [Clostridiales bacterium]|nr:orotidine-5'-phosphate decarboxylase [Clostridiales bacterium]